MLNTIGIRRETKDKTQRRAPLSPDHVRELIRRHRITVFVEPWAQRVFRDEEYRKAGAVLTDDVSRGNIVFGVKEIHPSHLVDHRSYCFFSHTVKGQSYNMPMLRHIVDHEITLFDYELVRDRYGKRLIYFSDFAGYAGMIDSLWALGRRLESEGMDSPFRGLKYATHYERLQDAQDELRAIGRMISRDGLPERIVPTIVAFTGYGRVASAAQQIFDLLPHVEIEPSDLEDFVKAGRYSDRVLYKVRYRKPDLYQHKTRTGGFVADHFHKHPDQYRSLFESAVPYLSMVINGIYWEPGFPKLLTKRFMKSLYKQDKRPRLRVIGDITCDIEGSIELTVKETDATNPVFVYEPLTGRVRDGWEGKGPVVLAVDKLPAELPREASEAFGDALMPFVSSLARAALGQNIEKAGLPPEFKEAMIVHRGVLRPRFASLHKLLPPSDK